MWWPTRRAPMVSAVGVALGSGAPTLRTQCAPSEPATTEACGLGCPKLWAEAHRGKYRLMARPESQGRGSGGLWPEAMGTGWQLWGAPRH